MAYEEDSPVGGLAQVATAGDPAVAAEEMLLNTARNRPEQASQQGGQAPSPQQVMQQMAMQRMQQLQGQQQQYPEQRKSALEAYQNSLRQNPMGNMTPTMQGLYSYVGNVGKMPSNMAAMQGIAAGGKALADMQSGMVKGDQAAAAVGYKDVLDQDKGDITEMAALAKMAGVGKAGNAGKYIQFSDDAGNKYIMNNATGERQVIPASKAKLWDAAVTEGYKRAAAEKMEDPDSYAIEFANRMAANRPGGVAPADAAQPPTVPVGKQLGAPVGKPGQGTADTVGEVTLGLGKADDATVAQVSKRLNAALQIANNPAYPAETRAASKRVIDELRAQYPQLAPTPDQATVQASGRTLQYENKPQAALREGEAAGIGKARATEYEAVQQAASAAEAQLQAFNTLEKIKPNTNAAANAQEHIAGLFNALGQDPNSDIIQNAIKNRQSGQILDQLRNASLKAEKGVQTKSDEDRIGREFPKTTDFSQAWNFGLKLGKERALRAQERGAYYDSQVDNQSGVGKARTTWNSEYAGDPITQYLGGKLVFRSDFINRYAAKYPDAGREGAVAEWREMEKDYQARGGRK